MPYPADLEGKYLDYQIDPGRTMVGGGAFVDGYRAIVQRLVAEGF